MLRSAAWTIALTITLVVSGATLLRSQQKSSPTNAHAQQVELSGKEMFHSYCASCHGDDAKGHGPASVALKILPPDLTRLAARNHGKFPTDYVNNVIVHGTSTPAHGSAEMPVWGPVFVALNDQRVVVVRVSKLDEYLESLQVP